MEGGATRDSDPGRRDAKRLRQEHTVDGFVEGGPRGGGRGPGFQGRGGGRFGGGGFERGPPGMTAQPMVQQQPGPMHGPGMPMGPMAGPMMGGPVMGPLPGPMLGGPMGMPGPMAGPGPPGMPGMMPGMPGMAGPGPMRQPPPPPHLQGPPPGSFGGPGPGPGPGPVPGPGFFPPAPHKPQYQDIAQRRRESHAALLRRQLSGVELSPALARGPLYEQYQAAIADPAQEGPKPPGPGSAAAGAGFAAIGGVRRCYMAEPSMGAAQEALVVPPQAAGYDPRAALEAAMRHYDALGQAHAPVGAAREASLLLKSEFGSFLVRPELAAALGEGRT